MSRRSFGEMSYGDRLTEAIKLSNTSRKVLAKVLGISEQAISKACTGATKAFSAKNTANAAVLMKVDAFWLATGYGVPRPEIRGISTSPLAHDVAQAFDKLPLSMRDRVYAQIMGTIDLANAALPATEQPDLAPTPEHPPH